MFILPKGYNIFILIPFIVEASIFIFTGTGKTTLSTDHNKFLSEMMNTTGVKMAWLILKEVVMPNA